MKIRFPYKNLIFWSNVLNLNEQSLHRKLLQQKFAVQTAGKFQYLHTVQSLWLLSYVLIIKTQPNVVSTIDILVHVPAACTVVLFSSQRDLPSTKRVN